MNDPRLDRLAALLLDYSLELGPGDVLMIDAFDVAAPFVLALHRAAIDRGAHVYAQLNLEGLDEILIEEAAEDQLTYVSDIQLQEMEAVDAVVTLLGRRNTRSFTRLDADRQRALLASRRLPRNRYWQRVSAGEAKWVGALMPTNAHAQDAGMSLSEYEEFVFGACHVGAGEDAGAHWRTVSAELSSRAAELAGARELRVVGPDTDLRVAVGGRTWAAADGKQNMPDGEVYTSPVEDGTEGEIRFVLPAVFNGRTVEDVRLRFESGRVVHAEAARGADYLRSLLDVDEGARRLGEAAFGLNYEIDRYTGNVLFDEKIGGTMHFALGASFAHLGGTNDSALHWDLICDLREAGEVYADGELIWRNGAFVHDLEPARA
ncbi:MAG: aminopeptidase [Gaiellaceae bacterium]